MDEKYVITLYEKIQYSQNITILKKNRVIKNATIDFNDDFSKAIYYDEKDQKINVENMFNPYTIISDDKYCYGYPLTLSDIEKMYPDIKDKDKLIEKYDSEINSVLEMAFYNKADDSIKIFTTNEETLKKIDDEDLFKNYSIDYDSSEEHVVSIKKTDFKKIEKMLDRKQYKKLKEHISAFNEEMDKGIEIVETVFDVIAKRIELNKEEIKDDNESLEDILNELNGLTGLNNIKLEINKLVKYLIYRDKTQKYLKLDQLNLHMFFTGNPGTGKTTVARIVGKILFKLGYLKKDSFAEITPRSLIAEYVGQTAVKTAEFIEKNRGGVIFLDEAYVLASDHQGFAEEALVEIIKELEKNETVFIFAGYKDEMNKFMQMNPGLSSRIGYYLEYKDYTKEELFQIFENKATKIGFIIDEKLKEKVLNNLEEIHGEKNFGNGRYIDKLINKIILEHAINTENYKRKKELITLKEKDFTTNTEETLVYKQKNKTIGF